jgi:glycosyltransferase involved in cell wall biosynthesis
MVLSTLYPPHILGGAEKSVSLIARGAAARGHEVSVLTLHDDGGCGDSVEDGVAILRRPLRNIYWPYSSTARRGPLARMVFHTIDTLNLPMARAVGEALRRYRPDIVLSNQLSGFSTLAWRAIEQAGVPVLHSLRDFYLLCPKATMFRGGKPCRRQCPGCLVLAYPRRQMSHRVTGVTGVSQYMIDRHRAAGLFRNAVFLPSILSAVRMPPEMSARVTAPPEPVRHYGYIGRVDPYKGLDLLLDGLATLPEGSWKLSIAGTGPDTYLAHLRQRCAGLPVTFLGFVPDTQFYREVDVVVVPSIWEEPLPRTVLEAFSHGLTVIASSRGGIPEVVRPGETGYLIDVDRPQDMAAALQRTLQDPLEGRAYAAAGRRMVMARTEAAIAADYEAASRRVIEHAGRAH